MQDLLQKRASNSTDSHEMTISEVSRLLGVTPEAIKEHVRKLYPYLMKNGFTTHLNQEQVTEIKKRMIPTTQVVGAVTDLEMLENTARVIEWLQLKYKEAKKQTAALLPRAMGYDRFLGTSNLHRMDEAAQLVGMGKNTLYRKLRELEVFRLQNGYNLPYQEYMDAGYFQIRETVKRIHEEDVSIPVIYATARGMDFIMRKLARVVELVGVQG